MKVINNVSIGADPELFLAKEGEVISAEGLIGGTKKEPKLISDEGHAIQEDNVMAEFNIPACNNVDDFVSNITFVKDHIKTLASLYGLEVSPLASATLKKKYLKTPQAKKFGCDPDYNVYTEDENNPVEATTKLRTCGGHIHVGYDNPSVEQSTKIIFAMDICLGLPSLALDTDDRRREMYGKAGAFRFKSYGVEYRTLSNFWIHSELLTKWAFNNTIKAIEMVNSGEIDIILDKYKDSIKEAIDDNNKDLAIDLINKIKVIKKVK